ncbi:MAG: FdrA family protein [Sciscionella sp.]
MTTRVVDLRRGSYQDSVTLMLLSRQLAQREGVGAALVAMATPLNLELLVGMGFASPPDATPTDMVVAIAAADEAAAQSATAALDDALAHPQRAGGTATGAADTPPPTVAAAARDGSASIAVVSTPGRVATLDAVDALDAGLDVLVFSDNVPMAQEVALKDYAAQRGRLVLGPDAGTAIIDGVALGFANVVRPGPVGMVAASGTGAQQILALLDGVGMGVRWCFGVGGRDLSAEVAGRSTLAALDRLGSYVDVQTIVVVSKAPDERVAERVAAHAKLLGKPVLLGYLGAGRSDLTALTQQVVAAAGGHWRPPVHWGEARRAVRTGYLRGLFAGGTLCAEAALLAGQTLDGVASNLEVAGAREIGPERAVAAHTFIDFGDDAFTAGRPHPMIDGSLRLARFAEELVDPECAAVLLDVVLGFGADPDPAPPLAELIAGSDVPVVVTLVGTRGDPQGRDAVASTLAAAGAAVFASNAEATRCAAGLVTGGGR